VVTVRYFAAARDAAGTALEQVPAADSVGSLIAELSASHGARLAGVLAMSSLVCDGRRLGPDDRLAEDACIEVLPPFAGG
jgi:sulfur-carrier protein